MSLLTLHYKSLLLQVRKSAIIERSSKMLVLPVKEQKYGSIAARKYVRTTTPRVHGDEVKHGRYAKLLKKIASLQKARKEKILTVRYQLDSDNYNIDERLNMAVDRLIENLITNRIEENEAKTKT
jgi:hypothetical protein